MRYTHSTPRKWTYNEESQLMSAVDAGKSNAEIATMLNRTEVSVQIKRKRMKKKHYDYNPAHKADKEAANLAFLQHLKPKSVFDGYAGIVSYYKGLVPHLESNDYTQGGHDYQSKCHQVLGKYIYDDKRFDLVDLDPFGSAAECFDMAIKVAKKGIVITFGELGHLRWKRLDYVQRVYGIDTLEQFTLNNLIKEVKRIGLANKKVLNVYAQHEWRNIGRVYFTISPMAKQASRIND